MMKYSAQAARWGLLMTTLALGATLVGTGLASFLSARATAEAVTKDIASDTLSGVRSAVIDIGRYDRASLETIVRQMQDQRVHHIAVRAPDGSITTAGIPAGGPWEPPPTSSSPAPGAGPELPPPPAPVHGPPPFIEVAPDRFRVIAPLIVPAGPGNRTDRMSGWRERPEEIGPERTLLMIEFEPLLAEQIRWRAKLTLTAELIATGVLLAMAATFWRSSRRAEAVALTAERDRQLRALGQMSAVLGHELRNPLASLKGHAQLLLEKLPEGHAGRRGAETIVSEAIRIEHLSLQVLEFVRTGTVDVRPADPTALARAALAAGHVDPVDLTAVNLPAAWPLDATRMQQVLVNLLKNAREASPAEAPVELHVAMDRGALVYEVRDRGEGLPSGDEDRAFEPFFTRKAKGTGLGLALARRIVDAHGGTIQAFNRPDGGAVFRVSLPGLREAGDVQEPC